MTQHIADQPCHYCPHSLNGHEMLLVVERPVPMGLVICPTPGCGCGSTWRAGTDRSTDAEIEDTRTAVRAALISAGFELPTFLR